MKDDEIKRLEDLGVASTDPTPEVTTLPKSSDPSVSIALPLGVKRKPRADGVVTTLRSDTDTEPSPKRPPMSIKVEEARTASPQSQRMIEKARLGPRVRTKRVAPTTGEPIMAAAIVVATGVAVPFMEPAGRSSVEQALATTAFAPYAVVSLLYVVAGAKVWDRSRGYFGMLRVSAAGMLLLGFTLAATAVDVLFPSAGIGNNLRQLVIAGNIAGVAVPIGFSLYGVLRGIEELRRPAPNRGYAWILICLSLIGFAVTYQLGRRLIRWL